VLYVIEASSGTTWPSQELEWAFQVLHSHCVTPPPNPRHLQASCDRGVPAIEDCFPDQYASCVSSAAFLSPHCGQRVALLHEPASLLHNPALIRSYTPFVSFEWVPRPDRSVHGACRPVSPSELYINFVYRASTNHQGFQHIVFSCQIYPAVYD
jgi:hypothetical protein